MRFWLLLHAFAASCPRNVCSVWYVDRDGRKRTSCVSTSVLYKPCVKYRDEHSLKRCWIANFNRFPCSSYCTENNFLILIIAPLWEAFCQTPIINFFSSYHYLLWMDHCNLQKYCPRLWHHHFQTEDLLARPSPRAQLFWTHLQGYLSANQDHKLWTAFWLAVTGVHDIIIILCHLYPTSTLVPPIDYLLNWKFQIRPMMTQ